MNLVQIIESLPPQVYIRRGELVIHFSSPADLASRVSETAASLAQLERSTAEPVRQDLKAERGRRVTPRSATEAGQTSTTADGEDPSSRTD
jgi:hypothetical protein